VSRARRLSPLLAFCLAVPAAAATPPFGQTPLEPLPPAGPALHLEARQLVFAGGGLDAARVSTCNTAACRANEVENSTAANSFCDVAPAAPEVAGAAGRCAVGCPRFLTDLGPNRGRRSTGGVPWDLGSDDAEKPCLVPDCVKSGVACLRGALPRSASGEVWDVGASLELQIPDIVSFPGDFWVALVLRKDEKQAGEVQCFFGDATHHFCVRQNGVLRLRLGSTDLNLSAAGALPPAGFHLVELWRKDGALEVAVDGVPATVGSPSASGPLVMAYLLSIFKGNGAFAGDLAMAIFYQRAPNEAERRQLGIYAGDLFGVGRWANRFRPPR
jgi:hypothetical protein